MNIAINIYTRTQTLTHAHAFPRNAIFNKYTNAPDKHYTHVYLYTQTHKSIVVHIKAHTHTHTHANSTYKSPYIQTRG